MKKDFRIAYFSMEIGLDTKIPTYTGGLGILAGDTLRSCADLGTPVVAITLINNKGYFSQKLDEKGNQTEINEEWDFKDFMKLLPEQISVPIGEREVKIQIWEHIITGINGYQLPVYFLDTDVDDNKKEDKEITFFLYGGDARYRLLQEIVLGIGGARLLKKIGYSNIEKYHLNEGHSALIVLELLKNITKNKKLITQSDIELVRQKSVFTTHTPVPSGHDKFPLSLVKEFLEDYLGAEEIKRICHNNELNMTRLALEHSQYVNGVTVKHKEISQDMFPNYPISSITNGVYHLFWTSKPFKELYDKYIQGWRKDPSVLRYALSVPKQEIMRAHQEAKKEMLDFINSNESIVKKNFSKENEQDRGMDEKVFTLGFARRMTKYKRPSLLFSDIKKLKDITAKSGPIQIIFSGEAHPKDEEGKQEIRNVFRAMEELKGIIKVAFLENYNIEIAKLLTAGVDVWLNTPQILNEASGTSGMKACFNGIPHLSILDGWWLEGHIENITGWSIGSRPFVGAKQASDDLKDSQNLYLQLEKNIIPLFYQDKNKWANISQYVIAFNASFFNSHRMVQQYVSNAYFAKPR